MPISKEDDKGSWEQYHIILLSHIVLYWIWSLLDSDESLLVTWVCPPIFSLQNCCRFRKRMQLNMGGLRLNTLFSTTFSIIFFFTSFSFSSICLPSTIYISSFSILSFSISSFSILSFSIFSFNVCWSFLACLAVKNFKIYFMSLMPQIKGTFIKIERFKMNPCPSQKKMTRVRGSNIT